MSLKKKKKQKTNKTINKDKLAFGLSMCSSSMLQLEICSW